MYHEQAPLRALCDAIRSHRGDDLSDAVLLPWLDGPGEAEAAWLAALRPALRGPPEPLDDGESCRLYALSRALDLLVLSFTPERAGGHPPPSGTLARAEFAAFLELLGLDLVERSAFHPFFHEIVTVDPAPDPAARPRIETILWPGAMLGSLMILRAGCRVVAGAGILDRDVAESSTLYWSHARTNRPTTDLSVGWGSNSQWRTSFRQDHAVGGVLHYNVDAAHPLPPGEEPLTPAQYVELLRHRCLVTAISTGRQDDLWPYDLRHVEAFDPDTPAH